MNRKISSLTFLIIIILFSFPWVMVSCGGQPLVTATGFQAMSGTYGGANNLAQYGVQASKTHMDIWLVFALIVAIIGIIVGLLNGDKIIDKTLVLLSSLETLFLIIFPIQVSTAINRSSNGSYANDFNMGMGNMIQVSFRPAYWIALILSIAGIVLNAYFLTKGETSTIVTPSSSSGGSSGFTNFSSSDYVFCPNCGAKNLRGQKFCSNCGAKLP